jgi:lipoprotein-anchoring transpeptidase ErfK/SrfK
MVSRRQLLKWAGGASGVLAVNAMMSRNVFADAHSPNLNVTSPPTPLGRATLFGAEVYKQPRRDSPTLRKIGQDEVFDLLGVVTGDALLSHNNVWFKIDDGFVYSSYVQPVRDDKIDALPALAKEKFWGEISAPFIESHVSPDPSSPVVRRLYYSSVFRVVDAVMGSNDEWWYRLQHGATYGALGPFIPAAHLRRFDPNELSPLSSNVKDKRIEVNIAQQTLAAYEGNQIVKISRVSTGSDRYYTPRGRYRIWRKVPGQRLLGGYGDDRYDLLGVPFVTYFTRKGIAFHGVYWHNDFGTPRSHGCVNVPPDVARWIWRWVTPIAPYQSPDFYFNESHGTRVDVI